MRCPTYCTPTCQFLQLGPGAYDIYTKMRSKVSCEADRLQDPHVAYRIFNPATSANSVSLSATESASAGLPSGSFA